MRRDLIFATLVVTFAGAVVGRAFARPTDVPLEVLVRDEAGTPVPQAQIRCGRQPWDPGPVRDGEGFFVAEPSLATGRWFRVERPQDRQGAALPLAPVMVEVPSAMGPSLRLAVVLPPASHIAGRVVGPDGRGVARARVWAQDLTRRRWLGEQREDTFDTVVTDADGRFDLGGRAAVAHELAVTPDSREYLPTVVRGVLGGRTDVRVVLNATVSVTVTVRNSRGIPIEDALVIAERTESEPAWASIAQTETNTRGVGVLEHLDPNGTYELLAGGPGEGLFRRERWRPGDERIRLPPVRSIRGTVRDPRGAPLPGVYVEWVGRPPPAPAGILGPHPVFDYDGVETGADGSFELLRLPEGEICVTYRLSGVHGGPTARQVVSADSTTANQMFDPGESITVRLDSMEGATPGVEAMLFAGPGGNPAAWSYVGHLLLDRSGVGVFRGVRSGTDYRLVVRDHGRVAHRTGVRAGDVVDVALGPGLSIHGRVDIESGEGRRARVYAGEITSAETESDGTFVLEGLPPGTWRVKASLYTAATAHRARRHLTATADVEAGATVVIKLPASGDRR